MSAHMLLSSRLKELKFHKQEIKNVILETFIILQLLRMITGFPEFFYLATIIAMPLGVLIFMNLMNIKIKVGVLIFAGVSALMLYLSNGPMPALANTMYVIANVACGYSVISHRVERAYAKWLFYVLVSIFFIEWLFTEPDYGVLFSGSKNQIFVLLFAVFSIWILNATNKKLCDMSSFNYLCFYPACCLAIISIFMCSYSSILVSFSLLAGLSLLSIGKFRSFNAVLSVSIVWLVIIFFYGLDYNLNWEHHYKVSNLIKMIFGFEGFHHQTPRAGILKDYLTSNSFFVGSNYNQEYFGLSNLHNSYLLFHSKYGFFVFLLFGVFLISFFRGFKNGFKGIILSCFLLSWIVRGFFDTVFFSGSSVDYILYALVISPLISEYHFHDIEKPHTRNAATSC
ncbi:hypothetical protein N9E28_00975 [Alphaproteobacteria bacterium]|nr:hypothetical protein [Alphaproteobacteria bacterium]